MASARITYLVPFLLAVGLVSLGTACSSGGGGAGGSGGTGGSSSSSSSSSSGAAGSCFDYTKWDGTTPATHFQADVLPIFRNSCGLSSSCHQAKAPLPSPMQHYYGPAKMDPAPSAADIQAIFDQSVDKPSVEDPSVKTIASGDPKNSYLMDKLDGLTCRALTCTPTSLSTMMTPCGVEMPQGGFPMDEGSRDTIRRWIAQGAKND